MGKQGRRERALALLEDLAAKGSRPLEPNARLADVGFDSLAFVELAAALERDLGVDLTRALIDERGAVETVLRAVEDAEAPTRVRLPRGLGRLQGVADAIGGWALRWWFRLLVVGAENVPRTGPAVLAMNHESALDIPIIVVAAPRRITFMAKKELFKNAFVSWSLRELGGFRVDRDRFDLAAVHMALDALERGDLLGMYPEGTRAPGELLPFLRGAAWVALRIGVPLVPCSISGTDRTRWGRRRRGFRVRVEFHQAIPVQRVEEARDRRRRAVELTSQVREAIEAALTGRSDS